MDAVITIPAMGDNFIFLFQYDQSNAFAVDPGDSLAVLRVTKERELKLTEIFVTHHHWDHIAGIDELKKKTGCKVIGSDKQRVPGIDRIVDNGQILTIGSAKIQVIATPGHTRTAVCYYVQPSNDNKNGILWTGDTLFIGGCGRLCECTARAMWHSLQKLASLPDRTLVYCGHDYTLENYEFALSIEPGNQAVKQRLREVQEAQSQGRQTVPSTMLQEKTTNPFLRADTPELKAALNMPHADAADVFAALRRRKDFF